MPLETLPSEILLQIISYLTPIELARVSVVCRHFRDLSLDPSLWKRLCFESSHAERRRRHNLNLVDRDERYGPLLRAMLEMGGQQYPITWTPNGHPSAEMDKERRRNKERLRIMANWDPSFPRERIDWREEYVQRHANVQASWFEGVGNVEEEDARKIRKEVTGVGVLYASDGEVADKVVGALDDGSVCIWEAEAATGRGRVIARSRPGLLTNTEGNENAVDLQRTTAIMTETGAVECVSVDSHTKQAYFAVFNELVEVDLRTLKVISREKYPFSITALSEARYPNPMTVGTNMTLHMYDPRDSERKGSFHSTSGISRIELIGGRNDFSRLDGRRSYSHATLAEPGPLSILHLPEDRAWDGNGDIWVAGRFTSLLNYDRRFFPKLRGHLHSGGRISCLRSTPNPFLPRELSLMRTSALSAATIAEAKAISGTTLLAAGEYKGKGSLELYGLSSDPARTSLSSDYSGTRARGGHNSFLNRQTASSSKLLSVAPHGGKIVFSDGDGNVRWVERDGFSPVRVWNLNGSNSDAVARSGPILLNNVFGPPDAVAPEDIVQLLLPTRPKATTVVSTRFGEDNLILWTGEGKLGLLSFGTPKWDLPRLDEDGERFSDRAAVKEERDYDKEMGMALRAHANELNFLRELGLG